MKIYGYGEDCLTLWALSNRTTLILKQLNDDSSPEKTVMLYRPSFGRGGAGQFGEFDAIISTPVAIYLVEAKWTHSTEIRQDGTVCLQGNQMERHRIFRQRFSQWSKLAEPSAAAFAKEDDLLLISPTSRLANNMHEVFDRLGRSGRPLVDVLLYLRLSGDPRELDCKNTGFKLVEVPCEGKGFVELGAELPAE